MAMKQWHRTAEMQAGNNDMMMGLKCDSDEENRQILIQ